MKFKTIVLTKGTVIAAAAITVGVGVIIGTTAMALKNAAIPVFKTENTDYEELLSEGFIPSDKNRLTLEKIKNKLFGMDTDKAKNIIGEYSAALSGTSQKEKKEEKTEVTLAPTTEPQPTPDTVPLPSHEEICAARGLKINNPTNYSVDLNELCTGNLSIHPKEGAPTVLVMHTHTTECYVGDEMSGETERTTDENKNVIAVGNEICAVLESYGIKTIHDTTYHDYPSYQGSYTRALTTIDNRLKENPSVNVVLDVHRDAFIYEDGSRLRVECEEKGIKTAQVMLVVGTDSMGLWHDNWRENLRFAAKIQNSAEIMYPNLMRPINLRIERFNQHMTLGSLILEVGSNGNTLEEAKEGGRDVAHAIAAALING